MTTFKRTLWRIKKEHEMIVQEERRKQNMGNGKIKKIFREKRMKPEDLPIALQTTKINDKTCCN